ncbi:MAG: NUDIX hydrolase [Anaerolineae bacterium]|nr:NUDIX hydrolase [Anaerolineae bacterium]
MTDQFIVIIEALVCRADHYVVVRRSLNEDQAPGALSFVSGKIEAESPEEDILEATVRRELREEIDLEVGELAYVFSNAFRNDRGEMVICLTYLCRDSGGEPSVHAPDEVESVGWMRADDLLAHPDAAPWLRESMRRAEALRQRLGW